MGHGPRGGRGANRKPPDDGNGKKNKKNSTNSQKETTSESSDSENPKRSNEDIARAADLEIARAQAQQMVTDEIFQEEVSDKQTTENSNRSDFLAAPGDLQRSQATTITKRQHQVKRRRHSLDDDVSIRDEIFEKKSFEEQTIIVVNNLSAEIDKTRSSYIKESKAVRGEIKALDTDIGREVEKITNLETTVTNMTNKIEEMKTTIADLKNESKNGKESVHDLVSAVKALSTRVEEQHTTIRGLISGEVDLKDTTGIQEKIREVMEKHLKSLSDTVVKQSERNVNVTQNRCNAIFTIASKLLNGQDKAQKTQHEAPKETNETIAIDEEIISMSTSTSNCTPLDRSPSGANHDGSHGVNPKPNKATNKSYANTTKSNLPPGAAPEGPRFNHKQNNRGKFDNIETEGPEMVRKVYASFPDGNLKWNEEWVPAKKPLTEEQKARNKKQGDKDRDRTDTEVIVFEIPTRDNAGRIHSKDFDNAQVVRLLKECARGGYWLKPGDIKGTIRQITNNRHPQHIPITVTCKDKDVAEKVLTAASNIFINGSRKARHDDEEKGRFGYLRRSLSEKERKDIRDKKRMRATPAGQGQAEIRKRQYESRTKADEWAEIITEDYNGEEDTNNSVPTDVGTMEPSTPTRMSTNQDENLNRISPKQATTSQQSTKETENEMLRKQIETMTKHAEAMAAQNEHFRQRNENLEGKLRKDNDKEQNQA